MRVQTMVGSPRRTKLGRIIHCEIRMIRSYILFTNFVPTLLGCPAGLGLVRFCVLQNRSTFSFAYPTWTLGMVIFFLWDEILWDFILFEIKLRYIFILLKNLRGH